MNFLNVPKPQMMFGWGSILGTIGGVALAGVTGGASIPIASAIGGAIDAHNAEKKAAKQQVAGAEQANARLAPYNTLGLQSANSLAGLLGLPGLNAPGGPSQMAQMGLHPLESVNRGVPSLMGTTQPVEAPVRPRGQTLAAVRMGPTSSRGPAPSSYGGHF